MQGAGTTNQVCISVSGGFESNKELLPLYFFGIAKELGNQLENWLGAAELTHGPARAIIAPFVYFDLFCTKYLFLLLIGRQMASLISMNLYYFTVMPGTSIVALVQLLLIVR